MELNAPSIISGGADRAEPLLNEDRERTSSRDRRSTEELMTLRESLNAPSFRSKESTKYFNQRIENDESFFTTEQKMWLMLNLTVVVWLLAGGAFYVHYEGWSYDQALFYAVNVGLGIGYGEMTVKGSSAMLFTVLYCMMGSAFIASTGGLVLKSLMERQDEAVEEAKENREANPLNYKTHNLLERSKDGFWAFLEALLYHARKRKGRICTISFFLIWTIIGVIFSMLRGTQCDKKIDAPCDGFIYGLFFSVTSMSTAAQVPPKHNPESHLFVSIWIFVGIPLYGAIMALIADTYIDHHVRRGKRWEARETRLDGRRFQNMCSANQNLSPSDSIRDAAPSEDQQKYLWGNYLEYRLREFGAVDRKLIDAIKDTFEHYDDLQVASTWHQMGLLVNDTREGYDEA